MALTKPFAENGDKKAIPENTTGDGSLSYDTGFGGFYALPPEEGGLYIDRAQFNQLMYDTTSAVISNQNSINTLNSKVANIESSVSTGVVSLTGNQTIAGVKTFSSIPISATQPTDDNQVANKAYVDSVGNTAVKLTGNQTIAGTKTFSAPVVVPDATAITHAVNLDQLNTKANWNAVVNLTDNQTIAGAKTFTSNITAPNITTMQNSINTLDGKVTNIQSSINQVISSDVTPIGVYKNVENKTVGANGDFKTIQEAFIYVQTRQKQGVTQGMTLTLIEDLNNPLLYFRGAWYPYLTIDCNGFILANKLTIDLSCFLINNLKLNDRMIAASSLLWLSGDINIKYTSSDYPGGCITAQTNTLIYVACKSCNFSASSNKSAFYSQGNSMIFVRGTDITQTSGAYCFAVGYGGIIQAHDGLNLSGVTVPKANIAANTITRHGIIFGNYTL